MPEPDDAPESTPTIGPALRVRFMGATLLGLLGGIMVCTFLVAQGLERLNRNMEDRPTHDQIFRWSLEARAVVPQLPMYVPPVRKD